MLTTQGRNLFVSAYVTISVSDCEFDRRSGVGQVWKQEMLCSKFRPAPVSKHKHKPLFQGQPGLYSKHKSLCVTHVIRERQGQLLLDDSGACHQGPWIPRKVLTADKW